MQETATPVMAGGTVTVTVAWPALLVSCVDVAVSVADPAAVGVKTPELLTLPIVEGVIDQVTVEL